MSYSVSIRGASIAALLAAAASELDKVVSQQPAHAHDREAALANLQTHAQLVGEPSAEEELVASMHGSVSVRIPQEGEPEVVNAGSGCSVYRQSATKL